MKNLDDLKTINEIILNAAKHNISNQLKQISNYATILCKNDVVWKMDYLQYIYKLIEREKIAS